MAAVISQFEHSRLRREAVWKQNYSRQLEALKKIDASTPTINIDFIDCNIDDAGLKIVVDTLINLFKQFPTVKVELFDISGVNSLTDGCKDDLIKLLNNLPDTEFLTGGGISVNMEKDNFEEVQTALNALKEKITKKGGVFLIPLNNAKQLSAQKV